MKKLGLAKMELCRHSWRSLRLGNRLSASAKDLIAASIKPDQSGLDQHGQWHQIRGHKIRYDLLLVDARDNTAKQISDTEDALTKTQIFAFNGGR
jgi:hypothetical protein